MTFRVYLFLVLLVILSSCSSDSERREFYDSGNLKSVVTSISDTIELKYFYDDTALQVRTRKRLLADTVVEVQYFSQEGELFFESILVNKPLQIEEDSSAIMFDFVSPKYSYLSLSTDFDVFADRFDDFYYDLKRGNGYHIRLPMNEIKKSLIEGVILDEHYVIKVDSSLIITAEHTYFTYP
ncbi:MAG: hypothetical protein RIC80_02980 [Cyclobacteriaceae bacterium]